MNLSEIIKYVLVFITFVILSLSIALGEGALRDKIKEIKSIAIRYVIYRVLDWGLMLLSIVFVAIMKKMEANIFITTFFMWILDYLTAHILLLVCLKSKQDLTLGRQYRKGHDFIKNKSKISGLISITVLLVKGIIWDGPERLVEFWHIELKTNKSKVFVLVLASLFQAIFWTSAYWFGLELL